MMNNPSIGMMPDLSSMFKAQEEQAQEASQSADQTAYNLFFAPKSNDLAQAKALTGLNKLQPDAPALKFGVQATGVTDGIGKGLEQGVNNFMAIKKFKRDQQLAQQVGDLYSNAIKQDQLSQQVAQRRLQLGNQTIRTKYGNELGDLDLATGGAVQKKFAELQPAQELEIGNTGRKSQAELQAKIQKANQIRNSVIEMTKTEQNPNGLDIFNASGQIPAGIQNALSLMGWDDVKDSLDDRTRRNNVIKSDKEAYTAGVDTQLYAQQELEKLQGQKLANVAAEIKNFYDPERMRLDIEGQGLTNSEKVQKLNELENASRVYQGILEKQSRGEQFTPQDFTMASMTLNFLAHHDPKIGETVRQFAGIKSGKPITQKDIEKVFGSPPNPAPTGSNPLSSGGVAGHIVQAPSGAWYDRSDPLNPKPVNAPSKPATSAPKPAPRKNQRPSDLQASSKPKADPLLGISINSDVEPGLTKAETTRLKELLTRYKASHTPTEWSGNDSQGNKIMRVNPIKGFANNVGASDMGVLRNLLSKRKNK